MSGLSEGAVVGVYRQCSDCGMWKGVGNFGCGRRWVSGRCGFCAEARRELPSGRANGPARCRAIVLTPKGRTAIAEAEAT